MELISEVKAKVAQLKESFKKDKRFADKNLVIDKVTVMLRFDCAEHETGMAFNTQPLELCSFLNPDTDNPVIRIPK